MYGPQKNYKYYGHYLYEAKAGLNTLTVIFLLQKNKITHFDIFKFYNRGKRKIRFQDGQEIEFSFGEVLFYKF